MIGVYISSPKRNASYVGSMKPFSEGEPGSLGIGYIPRHLAWWIQNLICTASYKFMQFPYSIIPKKQRFFSLSHLTLLFQLFESYIIIPYVIFIDYSPKCTWALLMCLSNQQENKRQHTTLLSKAALSHEETTPSEQTLPNRLHGNMEQTNTSFNNAQSTYPP